MQKEIQKEKITLFKMGVLDKFEELESKVQKFKKIVEIIKSVTYNDNPNCNSNPKSCTYLQKKKRTLVLEVDYIKSYNPEIKSSYKNNWFFPPPDVYILFSIVNDEAIKRDYPNFKLCKCMAIHPQK